MNIFAEIIRRYEEQLREAIIYLTKNNEEHKKDFLNRLNMISISFNSSESFFKNHPLLQDDFINEYEGQISVNERQMESLELLENQLSFNCVTFNSMYLLLKIVIDLNNSKEYEDLLEILLNNSQKLFEIVIEANGNTMYYKKSA